MKTFGKAGSRFGSSVPSGWLSPSIRMGSSDGRILTGETGERWGMQEMFGVPAGQRVGQWSHSPQHTAANVVWRDGGGGGCQHTWEVPTGYW